MQQRVPTSDASGVESRWRGAAAGDGGEVSRCESLPSVPGLSTCFYRQGIQHSCSVMLASQQSCRHICRR